MMFEATLEPPKKFDHLPPGNRQPFGLRRVCSAAPHKHRCRSSAPLTSFVTECRLRRTRELGARSRCVVLWGRNRYHYSGYPARMAELADAMDSKSIVRKGVWVQVPLRARFFRSAKRQRLRRNFAASQIRLFTPQSYIRLRLCVLCGFRICKAAATPSQFCRFADQIVYAAIAHSPSALCALRISAKRQRLRRNFRRSQIRLTRRNRSFVAALLGLLCGFWLAGDVSSR